MSELKKLLTIKRDRSHIGKGKKYPTALEMIRCGIGANYSGDYFDEVIDVVLKPIEQHVKDEDFEMWLREECIQKPTTEAYGLAKAAWMKALEQGVNK